jgi:hypothetical protein
MTAQELEVIAAHVERVAEAVVHRMLRSADLPRGEKGMDGRAGEMGPRGEKGMDGAPGPKGADGTKGERGEMGPKGEKGADGRDGRDGTKGDPGRDGKDGRDGIQLEQVEMAAERIAMRMLGAIEVQGREWKLGERTVRIPGIEYRGVWAEGAGYERGDLVTFGGSLWMCEAATDRKPGMGDGAPWVLAAKKGRDGRGA